jgi:hypothetical protein
MQLSKEEFRRLGHLAVDMASDYMAELPVRPVFQRTEERGRQALMNMPYGPKIHLRMKSMSCHD